jgi:hypothetical protein
MDQQVRQQGFQAPGQDIPHQLALVSEAKGAKELNIQFRSALHCCFFPRQAHR